MILLIDNDFVDWFPNFSILFFQETLKISIISVATDWIIFANTLFLFFIFKNNILSFIKHVCKILIFETGPLT